MLETQLRTLFNTMSLFGCIPSDSESFGRTLGLVLRHHIHIGQDTAFLTGLLDGIDSDNMETMARKLYEAIKS